MLTLPPDEASPDQLPWQLAAELQDDLLTASNDLDRLQTLLSGACAALSQGFHGANALLAQRQRRQRRTPPCASTWRRRWRAR